MTSGPARAISELLAGLLGDALEPGDAADGEQDDVRRADAEPRRHGDVAELVEQNAEEEGEEEQDVSATAAAAPASR